MVKSSVFPKAINIIGERKDPFRNLWRNVLITALEDALGRRINEGFNTHFAKGAQEYFTYPNQDFKLVCDFDNGGATVVVFVMSKVYMFTVEVTCNYCMFVTCH